MRARWRCVGVVTACLWVAAGAAHAQEASATDAQLNEARAAFEHGRYAYARGDFEVALESFQRSYELTHSPELLYNIGQVADRLRQDQLALDSYERYLEERPDAADRDHVEARIRVLRAAAARASRAEQPADPVAEPPEEGSAAPAPATEPGGSGRLWTWVALGAGAVAAGAAGVLWWRAQSTYDELAEECDPNRCAQNRIDDSGGPTLQVLGNVAIAIAGAAVAAGLVLFFVEGRDGEEMAVSIAPSGLRVEGRF